MRWLLSMLLSVQFVHASVLFQAPGTQSLDYRAALKADGDSQTPTQAYLAAHPSAENRARLLNLFAEAQKSFLGNPSDEAKVKFTNLVSLISEDDWNREAREIFLHAYFRLAQLELDTQLQTRYLTQALLLGEDLNIPQDLFPPPLTRRFHQLRNEIPRQQISPGFFQDGWTSILFNGALCTRQNCPAIAQLTGEARVTFISDQWAPYTANTNVADINSFSPKRVAWISGDCERTTYSPAADFVREKKAFWSLNCGYVMGMQTRSTKSPINFQPVSAPVDSLPLMEVRAESRAFYKSGWFWAGVGAVAVAAIALSAKKTDHREPTTTYGY